MADYIHAGLSVSVSHRRIQWSCLLAAGQLKSRMKQRKYAIYWYSKTWAWQLYIYGIGNLVWYLMMMIDHRQQAPHASTIFGHRPRFVRVLLAQLCHLSTISDFWELQWINHLAFDQHVSDVVRSCNYHFRSLRHIRPLIDREEAANLACSIVASRLDYCNFVLYQWN